MENPVQITVKQFVKLKEYQEQRIRELWCEEQQNDVQHLIDLMEDIATAAVDATKSSQGYDALKQAKHVFTDTLLQSAERYRVVNPINNRRSTDTHTHV